MKVVIDIPEEHLEQIRSRIEKEDYDSPQNFINLAIENQLYLDRNEDIPTLEEYAADGKTAKKTTSGKRKDPLEKRDYSHLETVLPPEDSRINDGPIWGQYNRILPVKLTLRILANSIDDSDSHWIELDGFSERAALDARRFGQELRRVDEKMERKRGEKLSTALPTGENADSSMERFRTHFVGRADQEGNLRGASTHMKFTDIQGYSDSEIGITEQGIEFASLENPLIDNSIESNCSLSDDEREFYLEHVSENLPEERDAMMLIAESIRDGVNRPQELTEKVHEIEREWSDDLASTYRSGLISRMSELGLIKRNRVGQREVAYQLVNDSYSKIRKMKGGV